MKLMIYLISFIFLWRTYLVKGKLVHSYEEPTVLEDAIGTYELESIKSLISSSAKNLSEAINELKNETNESIKRWQKEMEVKTQFFQQSINNLTAKMKNTGTSTDGELQDLKGFMRSLLNKSNQKLSDLKLFVEHHSGHFQNEVGKTSLASQQIMANDCMDLYNLHYNASGTYWLAKYGLRVLCDMETDGGGWLVIQRRANVTEQVNFYRDWFSYKIGFGNLDTEFWIGNDMLHILTNQKPYQIRIDMQDYENGSFYAVYNDFRVGNEESSYVLNIGNYSGNASDAFTYHHGLPFTTFDRDRDKYEEGNCAAYFTGGGWYDRCYEAHLNGIYPDTPDRENASYISWFSRDQNEDKKPFVLTDVTMKIRPNIQNLQLRDYVLGKDSAYLEVDLVNFFDEDFSRKRNFKVIIKLFCHKFQGGN